MKDRYEIIAEDILAKLYDVHPPEPKPKQPPQAAPQASSPTRHTNIEPGWEYKVH